MSDEELESQATDASSRRTVADAEETVLAFPASWMRTGPLTIWTTRGTMRVGNGRISFKTKSRTVFDAPIGDVKAVKFPRYNLGTVVKFKLDGRRYRITFEQSSYTLYDLGGTEVLTGFRSNFGQARGIGGELKRRLGEG